MKEKKTIYDMQAEVCKVLSNPKRIEIINVLKDGEKTVTELVDILGVPKANVSQHLSIMKLKGILNSRREGVNIYYSISNPKIVHACMIMREVLTELIMEKSKMVKLIKSG